MIGHVIQYTFFVMKMYIAVDYILFRMHAAYYHIKFRQLEQSFITKVAELTDEIAVLKEKVVNKKRYKCKTCELFSKN